MYKKIRSRLSSQEKRKYVLEDVFWVPVDNCSSTRPASSRAPELHSEKLNTSETAVSNDPARNIARNRTRDR